MIKIAKRDHREYIKTIILMETNIIDEVKLNDIYEEYMEKDEIKLLSDEFLSLIEAT